MNKYILIRIIVIVVVIPVIAEIVRRNIQKKRKKELNLVNKNESYVKSSKSESKDSNITKSLNESEFIDSYNHPNYFVSKAGFILLIFVWVMLLYGLSYFLIYIIFEAPITALISAITVNIIFIFLIRHSINVNKNKILINLFSDKITFSRGTTQTLFEIPKNKILKLRIITENGTSIWPDEYILIDINSEYLKTVIEPVLSADKSVEYSELVKIKYLEEQVNHLKGVNKTLFKEQIFKLISV